MDAEKKVRVEQARKLLEEAESMAANLKGTLPRGAYDQVMGFVDPVTDKLEEAQALLFETEGEGTPIPEHLAALPGAAGEEKDEEPELEDGARDFMISKQEIEFRARVVEAGIFRTAADFAGDPIVKAGQANEDQYQLLQSAAVALEAAFGSRQDLELLLRLAEIRILQLEIKRARQVAGIVLQLEPEGESAKKAKEILDRLDSDPTLKDRGKCLIATAACGTPAAAEVRTLRRFRDELLEGHPLGRAMAEAYYRVSPPLARWLDGHPGARPWVRGGLVRPAAAVARLLLPRVEVP
jgi:hypothetical protein